MVRRWSLGSPARAALLWVRSGDCLRFLRSRSFSSAAKGNRVMPSSNHDKAVCAFRCHGGVACRRSSWTNIHGPGRHPTKKGKCTDHAVAVLDDGTICPRDDFARLMGATPRQPRPNPESFGNFALELKSERIDFDHDSAKASGADSKLRLCDVVRATIALAKEWGCW